MGGGCMVLRLTQNVWHEAGCGGWFVAAAAQEKTAARGKAENWQESQRKPAENRGKLREVADKWRKNRAEEPGTSRKMVRNSSEPVEKRQSK